jgi:hypothetical protein
MATMFPERLPLHIQENPKLSGERKVYLALKNLPDKYLVFYNIKWLLHNGQWGVQEGESDFIIAHPDLGVIILEVKGGTISYSAEEAQWYSRDKTGKVFQIKDPVDQSRKNEHALRRLLLELPSWPAHKNINTAYAVCFPDIFTHGEYIKPDLPHEIVLDCDDLDHIETAVPKLFHYVFSNKSDFPGLDGIGIIRTLLARSFSFTSPLSVDIDIIDQKLHQLTEQQFEMLALLSNYKRVAIAGCAGSGKTMLASLKAKQFAELGLNVLLICYNANLALELRKYLPNVNVTNFHELCRQAIAQTGLSIRAYASEEELNDTVLPEALLDAAQELGRPYDAIIVDEAQDFLESYWFGLDALLKEDGYLYIFYDDNQNLYGGQTSFSGLITLTPFQLTRNCRNTQTIHRTVVQFHNSPSSISCVGPEGIKPEIIEYHGEEQGLKALQKVLHHLVIEEHISSEDIAVLTPRGLEKTRLVNGLKLGVFTISPYQSTRREVIQATSIYRFKGLERQVIILTEIDGRTKYNADMVLYVGCSRARAHLIILHDADIAQEILKKILE